MNIATNLDHAAFHFPDRPAITEGSESASFSEFDRDANKIASALVSLGVQPGDHVALFKAPTIKSPKLRIGCI